MKVLFYISGHGFGHATRIVAIMEALVAKCPTANIYARTKVPKYLFGTLPALLFHYYDVTIDAGVVEKGIFSQDVYSTLSQYSEINNLRNQIVDAEVEFVRREDIDIIVSDIPPLASEIGHKACIPTIAIGNFSWDFIYEPYVRSYTNFADLIDQIRTSYKKTDILLRLPFHHDMTTFPRQRDIPLIVRKYSGTPEEIRNFLEIDHTDRRPIILVALRMFDTVSPHAIQELAKTNKFILLFSDKPPFETDIGVHVLSLEGKTYRFPDVVAVSDLVISKLGYGIVSECIAGKTPLMYPPRDDFAEYDVLRRETKDVLPSYLIPKTDFLNGKWNDHIKLFLSNQFDYPDIPINGAEIAADIILSYAT